MLRRWHHDGEEPEPYDFRQENVVMPEVKDRTYPIVPDIDAGMVSDGLKSGGIGHDSVTVNSKEGYIVVKNATDEIAPTIAVLVQERNDEKLMVSSAYDSIVAFAESNSPKTIDELTEIVRNMAVVIKAWKSG